MAVAGRRGLGVGEIEIVGRLARVERDRRFEGLPGLVEPAFLLADIAEVVVGVGQIGGKRDGALEKAERGAGILLLVSGQPEGVERPRIVRRQRQRPPGEILGGQDLLQVQFDQG